MFSFHKPKIYRSNNGCCICKAKSSSSRFTDSKKYETEFERCFLIKNEIRTGEICNACVLLVKRCKKLPPTANKNWAHVVDARQGHKSNNGKAKSQTTTNTVSSTSRSPSKQSSSTSDERIKKAERKICVKLLFNGQNMIANENESNNVVSMTNDDELKSHDECDCSNCAYNRELDELEKSTQSSSSIRRLKKTLTPKKLCTTESTSNSSSASGNSSDSNDEDEDYMSDDEKANSTSIDNGMVTRSGITVPSTYTTNADQQASMSKSSATSTKSKNKRKFAVKHMQRNESTFLDMNFWKREQVCCGIIFRNKTNDMVLIDSKLFTPCACRKKKLEEQHKQESKAIEECKQMEVDSVHTKDTNNNNFVGQTTSTPMKSEELTEKITVSLDDINGSTDDQLNDSINNPINELVVLNSSSGISSNSSDVSSVTEEEDSNSSSNNLISDHNLIAKNMINRTFGVL